MLEYAPFDQREYLALNKDDFNAELISFLNASPTAFHAVAEMKSQLLNAGFIELLEADDWQIEANKSYLVTRNDSSIVAFHSGSGSAQKQGWRMVGAHTDSPCLKIKPSPDLKNNVCSQLAVEVYGGVLLAPWFDRDLSLAGRVTFENDQSALESRLVNFREPVALVPSLAIHLDKQANTNRSINKQTDINLVLASQAASFVDLLTGQLKQEYPGLGAINVMDWEISAYDTQSAALVGLKQEYLVSARLDNLLSCFVGLKALLQADACQPSLLVCNDHEEVGSQSACGANGPFLRDVLERIAGENLARTLTNSLMISADNAHAVHPNFRDKHDGNHGPLLNAGPVIKVNANQRYATNSETSALFKSFCAAVDVPVQSFVARNDMGCGSTIGPITAGELGVQTIDIGCPQWGMHSIRETAGADDAFNTSKVLTEFYNYSKPLKVQN